MVVALLAAGGAYYFFAGTGDDGPNTPAAKDYNAGVDAVGAAEEAWRVYQGDAPKAIGVDDFWLTDTLLVRRLPGRVVAYDLKTGKETWTFPLDGPAEDRCDSSPQHSKNRVALLRDVDESDKHACTKLTVLDIAAGEEVYTTDLPVTEGKRPPGTTAVPVVVGETVVVGSGPGRMFDLTSGAVVPAPPAFAACGVRSLGLFGDLLLADSTCAGNTDDEDRKNDEVFRLRAFDANFQVVWEWETPKNDEGEQLPVLGVLAADPLVVEVGYLGHDPLLVRVDPATGETVPFTAYETGIRGAYMSACDGNGLHKCEQGKVVGDNVILMTTPAHINPGDPEASPGMQNTEFRNELVAYDLDTGEEAWRTGQVHGRLLGLVPTATTDVVAYQPANPNGTKGIVFAVDPATGKLAPLLPIGQKAHENDDLTDHIREYHFGGDNHQAVWRDGLFIVFSNAHRTATKGNLDTVAFALPK